VLASFDYVIGEALLASFPEHGDLVSKASELIYTRSKDTIIPREHQLEANVTLFGLGKDLLNSHNCYGVREDPHCLLLLRQMLQSIIPSWEGSRSACMSRYEPFRPSRLN
jgi:hypothetical protein